MSITVNGSRRTFAVRPSATLLEVLRDDLDLTGTKRGCDHGDCGACTVLVEGEPRLACITLALSVQGRRVDTIEGMARGADLHPLQDAFDRLGAVQCGFCTPGMLLSASALLRENPSPTREEIRSGLAGNLCRCTGYQKIVDAVADAAGGGR
jgi:aerobic-type carbon monoxide dehydrogenase small subunit (CoxS/CutS family)